MKYAALAAATGFGLGFSPVASGTTGAFLGLPLMLLLYPVWTGAIAWQIACCAVLAAAAVPICGAAERHFRRKDDRRIVADEYLTFPIGLIGLPLTFPVLALAFVTNRICDIVKPFPARGAQALPGGWGIAIDDFVSALYSLALNHAVLAIWGILQERLS